MKTRTRSAAPAVLAPLVAPLLVLALSTGPAAAQAPSVQWTFGDSLSDDGNIRGLVGIPFPPPPYVGGRFTNGPVWAEYLAPLVGAPLTPETNVAVGGAFTGRRNSLNGERIVQALGLRLPGLADQVDATLAGRPTLDPAGLYVVWAGSNDAIALVGDVVAAPPATKAVVRAAGTGEAVANVESAIRKLAAAGARRLLVPNIPDLGRVPDERLTANAAEATAVSESFNGTLRDRLTALSAELGVVVETVDVAGLLRDAVANPGKYGFSVVDRPCIEVASCILGGRAVQDQYLFFDDLHPTTRGHELLARMVAADGAAPTMVAAQTALQAAGQRLVGAGIAARQAARRAGASGLSFGGLQIADASGALPAETDGRVAAPDRPFSMFLTGTRAWGDQGTAPGRAGFSWRQTAFVAGADVVPTPGLLLGVAAGYASGEASFVGSAGDVEQDGYSFGLYASRFGDWWYADASGSVGRDVYDRIRRRTFVGPLVAEGRTAGWTTAAVGEAGLRLPLGPVRLGPFAGLRWTRSTVDGYAEENALFLNRAVEGQETVSRVASLGAQVEATANLGDVALRPRLRVAHERALGDGVRTVGTRNPGGTGIPVATVVSATDPTVWRLTAGLEAEVAERLSVLVEAETVVGTPDAQERSVTARVRWRF